MSNFGLEDLKNISPQKMTVIAVLIVFVLGYFYYFFLFQPLHSSKKDLELKLADLERTILSKEKIVKEVENNKKALLGLQNELQIALTKLPDQKEIPGLLSALSEAGRNSGLEFVLFEPVQSVNKEFYEEIPVKIIVNGSFHETAVFFEKVARLPRIVNVADMSMGSGKEKDESYILTTSCSIKTYMFVEKSDKTGEKKDEKKKDAKKQ